MSPITVYVIAWRFKAGGKLTVKAFQYLQAAEDWCAQHAVPHIAIKPVEVLDQNAGA